LQQAQQQLVQVQPGLPLQVLAQKPDGVPLPKTEQVPAQDELLQAQEPLPERLAGAVHKLPEQPGSVAHRLRCPGHPAR
jgi:hypothetical protein